ncbi:MAG: hypothetical protein SOR56_01305 [Oscillospiraceae bacterium]|nr:hypothetical protein [Oscillospiraceae bacterium]
MTNREQVTFSFEFGDYDNRNIAEIVSDMLDAIGVYIDSEEQARLEKWLGLHCDPETNNWGILEE